MSWLKRAAFTFGILLVVATVGYFALRRYVETYSFAPESPEQLQLAYAHAQCAGYYMVLRTALKQNNPNYAELKVEYDKEFERHAKMGFQFSPDKDRFKAQFETAVTEFQTEVIGAAGAEKVAVIVDARMSECFRTLFWTSDFVKRTLQQRADH